MFSRIISIIKKRQQKERMQVARQYMDCGAVEFVDGFALRVDAAVAGRKYMTIGDNCLVGGVFIFESSEGHISIGDGTYIGMSTFICRSAINIGRNVTIAWGAWFYDHNSHSVDYTQRRSDQVLQLANLRQGRPMCEGKEWGEVASRPITICDDAWIGMNCLILKGVTIGQGAIVGAGSVVTKDVEPFTVVGGNPAQVVKRLR